MERIAQTQEISKEIRKPRFKIQTSVDSKESIL
jgi:hypothetical protein